jgi:multiple sugar transport system substrate-binding protein
MEGKIMNKKLVALLVAGILSVGATGCASQQTTSEETTTTAPTVTETTESVASTPTNSGEKKIINIWTKDRHDADFVQARIDEYNATNTDNVQVVYSIYSDNYQQIVELSAANGELPDILVETYAIFQQYQDSGQWLDYVPYMDDEMKEMFADVVVSGWNEIDGSIYFLPTTGTTCRLFYNTEIFERVGIENPPTTLEEVLEDARLITSELSSEGIYGFAANMKSPGSALGRSLSVGMNAESGLVGGFDFINDVYDFTQFKDALLIWQELLADDVAFPGCESLDIDPLRTQFADGKIGMYFSYTHAEPGVYSSQFPMDTTKWDCVNIPTVGGKMNGKYNYDGTSAYLINAQTEDPELTFKVYKELFASLDFLVEYYEGGYGVSMIPAVTEISSPSYDYANKEALIINFDTDAILPNGPASQLTSYWALEGEDSNSIFAQIIYGELDVDKGLEDLTARYNAAYKKAIENGGYSVAMPDYDPKNPTFK